MDDPVLQDIQAQLLSRADRLCAWIRDQIPPDFAAFIQAEDIYQDVASGAFRSASARRLRTAEDWDKWLWRVTQNRLADALRTQYRLKRVPPGLIGQHMQSSIMRELPAGGRSPSRSVSAREFTYALRVALASLPDETRIAVELKLFEERSDDEIAVALRKSKSAARGIVYRGLTKLREQLGEASRFFSRAPLSPEPSSE